MRDVVERTGANKKLHNRRGNRLAVSAVHEINRLELNIENATRNLPGRDKLFELVEGVIEEYFDQFDIKGIETVFERIELYLGEIDPDNFEAEVNVRLRHLLNQELKEFFAQNDIKTEIQSRSKRAIGDLFDEYLQTGINAQNDRSLSSVFTKLVSDDIEAVQRILDSSESWPIIRERLFDQIDFSSYESYWIKSRASTYLPIRRINQKILQDFSERSMLDYGFSGLQGVLKKITYDFMFSSENEAAPADAYIKHLQTHTSAFQYYAHRISNSIEVYLQSHARKDIRAPSSADSFPLELNFAVRLDKQRILSTYLLAGRSPNAIQINEIRTYAQRLQQSKLIEIADMMVSDMPAQVVIDGILRIHQVFSPSQLKFLYAALSTRLSGTYKKSLSIVNDISILIEKAFGENIFSMSTQAFLQYYNQIQKGDSYSVQLVSDISKYLSARVGESPTEIIESIDSKIQLFNGGNVDEIQKATKGAKQSLKELDVAIPKKEHPSWSQLSMFIHFLETGLWILPTSNPQETLLELLESEVSGIRIALSERIGDLVLWVRLIYQFPIENVHEIFKSIFGLDEHYSSLTAALQIPKRAGTVDLERALLEVFIATKVRILSDEQAGFTGNFQLEYAKVLEPITKKTVLSDRFDGLDFQNELSRWIDQPNELPGAQERSEILQRASSRIDIIHAWLNTPATPMQTWQRIFSGLDKEQIIDLIKRFDEVVIIQELDSFVEMMGRTRFGKSVTSERLVSILIPISRGYADELITIIKDEWKGFKKADRAEALKAELVLNNSIQQDWIGMPSKMEDLDSFLIQLEKTLQSGHFHRSGVFESFQSFEANLRRYVETKEPRLLKYFEQTSISKLIDLLRRLSHTTLSALKIALDEKFKRGPYTDVIFSIKSNDLEERQQIDNVIIAYGLSSVQFHQGDFFQVLNQYLPSVKLPVISVESDAQYDESIVHALIHFLKFGRIIDERLTEANIGYILIWVLQLRRGMFLSALKQEASLNHILVHVLSSTPESKWGYIISLLLSANQDQIENEITELIKEASNLKQELADRLSIALKSQSNLTLSESGPIKFEPESFEKEEVLAISKLDQTYELEWNTLESELPPKLIRMGIRQEFTKDYSVFDIVESIIDSGKFPSWSNLNNPEEIELIIFALHRALPIKSKRFLETLLREKQGALRLLSISGSQSFLKIIGLVWAEASTPMGSLVDSLVEVHDSLGTADVLRSYFTERAIYASWPFRESQSKRSARLILSGIPSAFGLSVDEYVKVLTLKSLDQSNQHVAELIAGYLDSFRENTTATVEVRAQRNLDLLKHLVIENEVPWWADHSKTSPQQIQAHIKQFSLKLLSQDPNNWVTDLMASGHALEVFSHLVQFVDHRQFDRIVIAISPNLGGFIVSFNMLLSRLSLAYSETEWQLFVLEYVLKVKNMNAGQFIRDASSKLAEEFSFDLEKLQRELSEESIGAVQNGEIRFRPLVDLLEDNVESHESILVFPEEKNEIRSFDNVLRYYLKYGTIQLGTYPKAENYIDFVQELKRSYVKYETQIRNVIRAELKEGRVRSRIVRFESDHFIHVLISILFPKASGSIASLGQSIQRFVADLIGISNIKVIHDTYYATLFEQALSAHSDDVSASNLLITFMKKAGPHFKLESLEKEVSLEIYELNDPIKEFLTQSLFGGKSKLKLRTIEPDPTTQDSDEIAEKGMKLDVSGIDERLDLEEAETPSDKVDGFEEELEIEEVPDVELDFEVNLKNAGLVIVWPYLGRYFEILEMVKDEKFKSKKAARRAVQLLQHLVTGLESAPEHELLLNKVLCGVKIATPIPFEIELTDREREVSEQMLNGLLQNWPRLKNSSIDALREGFLVRDGRLIETDEVWQLTVEDKTLDILMDTMPWSFGIIKLPWMDKRMMVEWR
jgi:hypothetical protein